jgi:hypothetical protein
MKTIPYNELKMGMFVPYNGDVLKVVAWGSRKIGAKEFFNAKYIRRDITLQFRMTESTIEVLDEDEVENYLGLIELGK